MKKLKATKANIVLTLITLLSAVLNFVNLSIEGTGNAYYAAAVKSMTMSWKNFFFVSFDPSGFVTIDKPPLGFWFQAISAKIFGYSGWSIILPQALAGVLSVIVIYFVVKRSFGSAAGLISSLCLAVTPVFVAASRNNTVDNVLVLFLLLACWALSIAAEKGKLKYLIISMVIVGLGFNVKMLQAYMLGPALYITYLFSTSISIKKRLLHLVVATAVLLSVSLSWALVVDLVPKSQRPYIDSSTNNTVTELIVGHNGLERLGVSSSTGGSGAGGGMGKMPSKAQMAKMGKNMRKNGFQGNPPSGMKNSNMSSGNKSSNTQNNNMPTPPSMGKGQRPSMPSGGMGGPGGNMKSSGGMGNSSNLQGSFGGQVTASVTRLFSKNVLSDQIVWFLVLSIFGFIATAVKEKLRIRLDNKRKQSLVLWFMWLLPAFIFFSYTTGTFHPYYLTMLAPPIAALTGIGIVSMWQLYKENTWKAYFLPVSLIANGAVQLLMLNYFKSSSNIVKILMPVLIILCFGASILLIVLKLIKNENIKIKKSLVAIAMVGLLAAPFVGSSAVLFNKLNSSFPAAGLELLSSSSSKGMSMGMGNASENNTNSKLIKFLLKNKTKKQKYLLVVSNSNSAADIIINTGESVMSLGGFLGNNNPITLKEFKALVKKGEIRYVMTGGQGGGNGSSNNSKIMSWVKQVGKAVSTSKYSDSNEGNFNKQSSTKSSSGKQNFGGHGGGAGSGELYDLKTYTDSLN